MEGGRYAAIDGLCADNDGSEFGHCWAECGLPAGDHMEWVLCSWVVGICGAENDGVSADNNGPALGQCWAECRCQHWTSAQ